MGRASTKHMHIMFVVTVSVGKVTMRGHLLMLTWTPLHLGICHFDCFMCEFSGYCCAAMCWTLLCIPNVVTLEISRVLLTLNPV